MASADGRRARALGHMRRTTASRSPAHEERCEPRHAYMRQKSATATADSRWRRECQRPRFDRRHQISSIVTHALIDDTKILPTAIRRCELAHYHEHIMPLIERLLVAWLRYWRPLQFQIATEILVIRDTASANRQRDARRYHRHMHQTRRLRPPPL
jgi:hypothetical protein